MIANYVNMQNSMGSINNVCYEAKCDNCEMRGMLKTYDGETCRTAYIRCKEHYDDLKRKKPSSWMWKHIIDEHNGDPANVSFSWKVTRKCNKPIQRQLCEAVRINRKPNEQNLNTKCEYNGQRLRKINIHNDKAHDYHGYNCQICGHEFVRLPEKEGHEKMFHTQKQCTYCTQVQFGERGMTEHVNNFHT